MLTEHTKSIKKHFRNTFRTLDFFVSGTEIGENTNGIKSFFLNFTFTSLIHSKFLMKNLNQKLD